MLKQIEAKSYLEKLFVNEIDPIFLNDLMYVSLFLLYSVIKKGFSNRHFGRCSLKLLEKSWVFFVVNEILVFFICLNKFLCEHHWLLCLHLNDIRSLSSVLHLITHDQSKNNSSLLLLLCECK